MSDEDMQIIGQLGASALLRFSRPGELARVIAATAQTSSEELQEAGAAACALLLADCLGDEASLSLPFAQRQEVAQAARRIAGQIVERWQERDEAEGRPWKGQQ